MKQDTTEEELSLYWSHVKPTNCARCGTNAELFLCLRIGVERLELAYELHLEEVSDWVWMCAVRCVGFLVMT
jgi:hypothetical protein